MYSYSGIGSIERTLRVTLPAPPAAVSHAQLIRCFSSLESSCQVQGQRVQERQVACKYYGLHVCKGGAARGNEH